MIGPELVQKFTQCDDFGIAFHLVIENIFLRSLGTFFGVYFLDQFLGPAVIRGRVPFDVGNGQAGGAG